LCENFEEVRAKTPTWVYKMMSLAVGNLTGISRDPDQQKKNMRVYRQAIAVDVH